MDVLNVLSLSVTLFMGFELNNHTNLINDYKKKKNMALFYGKTTDIFPSCDNFGANIIFGVCGEWVLWQYYHV